jgi:hypothetical protein
MMAFVPGDLIQFQSVLGASFDGRYLVLHVYENSSNRYKRSGYVLDLKNGDIANWHNEVLWRQCVKIE